MSFFNPAALTTQQSMRWAPAMAEYGRILDRNAVLRYDTMTPKQRAHYLKDNSGSVVHDRMTEIEKFKAIEHHRRNKAGHPKSALFARLLLGLPILPVEPPVSYSYPWYELIEEEGPFPANITQLLVEQTGWPLTNYIEGTVVFVNHCPWHVDSMNQAAKTLLNLQKKVKYKAKGSPSAMLKWKPTHTEYAYEWPEHLYREVEAAYADGPEMRIRYGLNNPFTLKTGRTLVLHTNRIAMDLLSVTHRQEKLGRTSCVMDLDGVFMMGQVGQRITAGSDCVVEEVRPENLVELHYTSWFLHKHP